MKKKRMSLDDQIAKEYSVRSAGKVISMLDIPKLFADVRANISPDRSNIGELVDAGIVKYCITA